MSREIFRCVDCTVDTSQRGLDEYYMVKDALWTGPAKMGPNGMLCIGCIEQRIGRQLQADDFTQCMLTREKMTTSARLLDRYNTAKRT